MYSSDCDPRPVCSLVTILSTAIILVVGSIVSGCLFSSYHGHCNDDLCLVNGISFNDDCLLNDNYRSMPNGFGVDWSVTSQNSNETFVINECFPLRGKALNAAQNRPIGSSSLCSPYCGKWGDADDEKMLRAARIVVGFGASLILLIYVACFCVVICTWRMEKAHIASLKKEKEQETSFTSTSIEKEKKRKRKSARQAKHSRTDY